LENEIGQYKNDIEKLQQSKEGALTDVTKQFNDKIDQLTKKYQAEVKEREDEVDSCKKKIHKLEDQIKQLSTEIGTVRAQLAEKSQESEVMGKQIKELQVAVGDALKLKEELEKIKAENEQAKIDCEVLSTKFKEEQKKRKDLHNQLEDMKGAIRLFCRIRPLSHSELEREESNKIVINALDEFTVAVAGKTEHKYNFDSVFGPDSTQDKVFEETKRLI
jgi:chromosome segregation ATPase